MMNEQKQWVHGSLFSGIGGFDLAAQWMGWRNAFHCEMDSFCQKVLQHYWPDAVLHENVKTFNGKEYAGQIDILTGGFPCQPYSAAGKREGKNDTRHLWPEMLRIIREISPTWVVGENVHGLLNWSKGLVFTEIIADMEAAGYWIQPYLLPAAGVNAPHQRNRIFFICRKHTASHTHGTGARKHTGTNQRKTAEVWREKKGNVSAASGSTGYAANASNTRLQGSKENRDTRSGRKERDQQPAGCVCASWEEFPTESPICGRNDGLPRELDTITFSKWRNESVKAYGNAVVPPLILQIFRAIEDMENLMAEGITQISWDEFQQYQNQKDETRKAK